MRNRKPNRLKGYDYSTGGYYFVTVCTQNRIAWFGEIKNGKMVLNKYGEIVEKQWMWLGNQYPYIVLNEHVVMPNHIHGILIIRNCADVGNGRVDDCHVGTGRDLSLPKTKPLSELIGVFKTTSSKYIHQLGLAEFGWQRSFYDHVIRDEKSLCDIQTYIQNNPPGWDLDRNNVENLFM